MVARQVPGVPSEGYRLLEKPVSPLAAVSKGSFILNPTETNHFLKLESDVSKRCMKIDVLGKNWCDGKESCDSISL